MKACPYCKNEINKISIEPLSLCESCDEWVIPFEMKGPKKKNYRERNANRFSSLPESRTRLRPVSKKLNIKLKGYRASETDQTPKEEICVKCGTIQNLTKHHAYGRQGLTEDGRPAIEVWFWMCIICHDWVHANANEAMKTGYLQPEYRNQILNGTRIKPWKK